RARAGGSAPSRARGASCERRTTRTEGRSCSGTFGAPFAGTTFGEALFRHGRGTFLARVAKGRAQGPACLFWWQSTECHTLTLEASKMLSIAAPSAALNSSSDCLTESPSVSAREKE